MDNSHIREEDKYNPGMSYQSCEMIALDFGPECIDLRYIDLNVIKQTKYLLLMTPVIVIGGHGCQWNKI